jgi:hypothetical protein
MADISMLSWHIGGSPTTIHGNPTFLESSSSNLDHVRIDVGMLLESTQQSTWLHSSHWESVVFVVHLSDFCLSFWSAYV